MYIFILIIIFSSLYCSCWLRLHDILIISFVGPICVAIGVNSYFVHIIVLRWKFM